MRLSEARFLASEAGALLMRDAAALLTNADPETDDADLLAKVEGLGFRREVATRVFWHVLLRFAPLTCKHCSKRFTPRALSTCARESCNSCVKGPRSEIEQWKHEARLAATAAEKRGKLKREPCKKCGWQFAEKHHPDYSRPLYVIWLCSRCHKAEHRGDVSRATR